MQDILGSIGIALFKFLALAAIMFTFGKTVVSFILSKVILVHSRELFTLAVLALTFIIATGSAVLFGTSIALGAFLAGMVIGQTEMRHQALSHSLALKDVFVVIFFLSVGMLFNPVIIVGNWVLFLGVLFIILVIKPLAAFLITLALKHPMRTAITISIALAQIGEFSFILAEEAMNFNLLPEVGFDVIVACALISISINPLIFSLLKPYLKKMPEGEKIPGTVSMKDTDR
jgi:CPA2 family monovalent cation:H+ antiporter-2